MVNIDHFAKMWSQDNIWMTTTTTTTNFFSFFPKMIYFSKGHLVNLLCILNYYHAHHQQTRFLHSYFVYSIPLGNRLSLLLVSCSLLNCILFFFSGSVNLNVAPLFSLLFTTFLLFSAHIFPP